MRNETVIIHFVRPKRVERSQEHTLRPFHPLSASGSINFLDSTKPQICQLKRAETPPQSAWKHYYPRSHSVLSQLPLSCWREQDGICWLALCKLQNVFPRSFAQFAYRFQCFLLNQVRPCLNVLIFIFWSFTLLRERSGLVCVQLGFPPSKVRRYPKMFDVITSLPISKFQLLPLIGLDNSGVLRDSPSTCVSENQYIWVPESWVVKC